MKKTRAKKKPVEGEDLRSEYRFDYRKAKPNRFAARAKPGSRVILLEPDVAQVFGTPESVNSALRALIEIMPRKNS